MENRRYTYKGNTYVILGECKMKDSDKNWIDALRYRDINNEEKGEFVRSKKQFFDRFIPTELNIGDKILIVSMGKEVGVVTVVDIQDNLAILDKVKEKIPTIILKSGFIKIIGAYEYYYFNKSIKKERIVY